MTNKKRQQGVWGSLERMSQRRNSWVSPYSLLLSFLSFKQEERIIHQLTPFLHRPSRCFLVFALFLLTWQGLAFSSRIDFFFKLNYLIGSFCLVLVWWWPPCWSRCSGGQGEMEEVDSAGEKGGGRRGERKKIIRWIPLRSHQCRVQNQVRASPIRKQGLVGYEC